MRRGRLDGFLDEDAVFEGELRFDDTFRIDGLFVGDVFSAGDLHVGEEAEVRGEIEVGRLYVHGTVEARVRARERVEITSGGRLEGEVETPSLVIEEGGTIEGRCSVNALVPVSDRRREPGSSAATVTEMPRQRRREE